MENELILNKISTKFPEPPAGKKGWPWEYERSESDYKDLKNIPKISIITPSYNQGQYLEETIRSVLLQNYPNLEYIIIDGGSTDNSVEIIKKYDKWIKYWVSENDEGQSDAINKGLSECTGEIFNWINSDDYYDRDCFKRLAEYYDPSLTDIIAGDYRFFYEGEDRYKTVKLKLRDTIAESIALVHVHQPSTFIKLDLIKEFGGLNNKLHFIMDQEMWIKYLFKYGQNKIRILNEELAYFRFHLGSKTSNNDFMDEHINIYYSIAIKNGLTGHAEALKRIYGFKVEEDYDLDFKFDQKKEYPELAAKVINSLIFAEARKAYTSGDREMLKLCLSIVEKKYLNSDQRKINNKLKIKAMLLRLNLDRIIKIINKTNSMLKK
ncbi:MAG TPA: glycosyltransferase family 2 protein [Ignavibacteria bacterium]|nr:glycosyltransferase family 2 protein [Ignavibacteria bacterium]